MKARLFLSCGQNKDSAEEMKAVESIETRLREEFGFDVFVAIRKNFLEGNPAIFEYLKQSDYYIFINFERPVEETGCYCSLYTHQELAMAFAYGFDRSNMLLFHKNGLRKSGILAQIIANKEFNGYSDVPEVVLDEVRKQHWSSDYSRKLVVKSVSINPHVDDWRDKNGTLQIRHERMALVEITNRRNDYAAINCQMHLRGKESQYLNYDRAPVKASGLKAYSHTIWPGETVQFDLFGYDVEQKKIFMHTECDVSTPQGLRKPLLASPGDFILTYEVYAEHFPVSTFDVKVHLGDDVEGGIEMSLCENLQPEQPSVDLSFFKANRASLESTPSGTGFVS